MAVHPWPTDPHVRGGYSFLPPESKLEDRLELERPLDDIVFFAGEAAHARGGSASVHGAIETGYRAASDVLQSMRPTPPA